MILTQVTLAEQFNHPNKDHGDTLNFSVTYLIIQQLSYIHDDFSVL